MSTTSTQRGHFSTMHTCALFLLVLVVVYEVWLSEAAHRKLELNLLSTIYDDVESITHDTTERKVMIELYPARRCDSPTFILRLSGSALHKLLFDGKVNNTFTYGYPPLVDPGKYFLEVVVLFCTAYNGDAPNLPCFENVYFGRNVVSLPYEFVVPVSRNATVRHPRWVLETPAETPTMLHTRHQRLVREATDNVTCAKTFSSKFCNGDHADTAPFDVYRWIDGVSWQTEAKAVFDNHTTTGLGGGNRSADGRVINICFVGDSHSRMMAEQRYRMPKFIQFTYVLSLFPVVFNTSLLETHRCSVAVISHGLWTLARSPYVHMKTCFQREQEGLVSRLLQWRKPGGPRLYFRSENHNGLLANAVQCGGVDLRSPPGFDMINRVKEAVCRNHQLEFIDMDHIMYPMWDGAFDFCHPSGHVFSAEIDLILHRVFTDVLRHKEPLMAFTPVEMSGVLLSFAPSNEDQLAEVDKLQQHIAAGDVRDCTARPRL